MMKIVRCDRCGTEIEKCPTMRIQVQLIRERVGSCYQSNRLDLCQKCEDGMSTHDDTHPYTDLQMGILFARLCALFIEEFCSTPQNSGCNGKE